MRANARNPREGGHSARRGQRHAVPPKNIHAKACMFTGKRPIARATLTGRALPSVEGRFVLKKRCQDGCSNASKKMEVFCPLHGGARLTGGCRAAFRSGWKPLLLHALPSGLLWEG